MNSLLAMSAAALLCLSIIYSKWEQQKLIIFFTVSSNAGVLSAKDFAQISAHAEHTFEVLARFGERNVEARNDHILTQNWRYAMVTRPFATKQDSLEFAGYLRRFHFLQDVHSMVYKSKSLKSRLFNAFLMVKRALSGTLGWPVMERREDKEEEEDEIIDEDHLFCLDNDDESEKAVTIQLSQVSDWQLAKDFDSTVIMQMYAEFGAWILELGEPDSSGSSDSWDRVLVSLFPSKRVCCDLRMADEYRKGEDKWKRGNFKEVSFWAKPFVAK